MNFRFDYHNKILTILQSLNCNVLENGSAYFGGGTILTLDFDEYRWSKDIEGIITIVSELNKGADFKFGAA
ncbi:hypothetical protein NIES2101_04765 [Calothrix sp. HK-06]|nr:hypothetical protein NIES2101_04765 [Calothrix sp. HK-06]